LVNFNAPDGSAATDIELLAALEDAALDAVDVLPAALAALLLLPLEPPHALRPSATATTASVSLDGLGTSHISLLVDRLNI
jgi:hypothetical protein